MNHNRIQQYAAHAWSRDFDLTCTSLNVTHFPGSEKRVTCRENLSLVHLPQSSSEYVQIALEGVFMIFCSGGRGNRPAEVSRGPHRESGYTFRMKP